jgi:hypothetical protein
MVVCFFNIAFDLRFVYMQISESHPLRILLITSGDDSDNFSQSIRNADANTRVAVVNHPVRLLQLLNMQGQRLPHLIFVDLVHPIRNVFENSSIINRCSVINLIPVIVFTTLVPSEKAVESFLSGNALFVRKRQTPELLTENIGNLLKLDWRKYLSEKKPAIPLEPVRDGSGVESKSNLIFES